MFGGRLSLVERLDDLFRGVGWSCIHKRIMPHGDELLPVIDRLVFQCVLRKLLQPVTSDVTTDKGLVEKRQFLSVDRFFSSGNRSNEQEESTERRAHGVYLKQE